MTPPPPYSIPSLMKLGCVPYINALPLTAFLDPKEFEIITRPPAQLFNLLQEGQVEAALLPIVNYFEAEDLHLIPDIAIATQGPVRSVKLFFKDNCYSLKNVDSISLDSESKTSNLLLKALLHHRAGRNLSDLTFFTGPNHPEAQAKLLIGDKALDYHPSEEASLDLGQIWQEWTGKPFVFAAWMTQGSPDLKLKASLLKARDQGLNEIESIIQTLPRYPADFLKEYFTRSVHYYMGSDEQEGIRTFFEFLKPIQGYRHELDFRFIPKN